MNNGSIEAATTKRGSKRLSASFPSAFLRCLGLVTFGASKLETSSFPVSNDPNWVSTKIEPPDCWGPKPYRHFWSSGNVVNPCESDNQPSRNLPHCVVYHTQKKALLLSNLTISIYLLIVTFVQLPAQASPRKTKDGPGWRVASRGCVSFADRCGPWFDGRCRSCFDGWTTCHSLLEKWFLRLSWVI